jgi:hypothetical protein
MFLDHIQTMRLFGIAALTLGFAAGAVQAQSLNGMSGVPGNIVGGGSATISGGGEDMTITYSSGGAGGGGGIMTQASRQARFASPSGDGQEVEYPAALPAGPGREAWLSGGGENAEVVYTRPR